MTSAHFTAKKKKCFKFVGNDSNVIGIVRGSRGFVRTIVMAAYDPLLDKRKRRVRKTQVFVLAL